MTPQLITTGHLKCQTGYFRPTGKIEVGGCFPWHDSEIPYTSTKSDNTETELIQAPASKPKHITSVIRLLGDSQKKKKTNKIVTT